ncbi:hypothetical protein NQZ68_007249 [Dissostichus eleginoides]|nr:hypothetical protein NQZ68_007249 [Dissostichus eleginoides]
MKHGLHQECDRRSFSSTLRRQGVGCSAETGRRKGGDFGIVFVLTPQYNTQLEKQAGSSQKIKTGWDPKSQLKV